MKTLIVFTEELSAKVMLESLLPRLLPNNEYHFRCVAFEGKQDLEKQLPVKLRGWRTPGTCFVVLRDQDNGDCINIKENLQKLCERARKPDTLVRIACRELESWYLGDLQAVEKGLGVPGIARLEGKASYGNPDKIRYPSKELRRLTKDRYQKVSGSRVIGKYLRFDDSSRSRSFRHFVTGVSRIMELPVT